MDMVKDVEAAPSKFSAETRCFADLVRAVDNYHRETQKRADWVQTELTETKRKLITYEQDYRDVSTEFRVPLPEPGTDEAKLMLDARNARNRASELENENLKLLGEIDEWKDASGLECGGDPGGVTPQACREYWENFKRVNTSPILYWSHVPMGGGDSGWNLLECRPDHRLQPLLKVTRGARQMDASVSITFRSDDDKEIVIAEVVVPFRDDLEPCSICGGNGYVVLNGSKKEECPWCLGVKSTAMDEAKEIACALYWSWLRSPNGGGSGVI
jgi:hypothetical protein